MPIRVKCSKCGKTVKANDDWAGRSGNCPGCRAVVIFPPAEQVEIREVASVRTPTIDVPPIEPDGFGNEFARSVNAMPLEPPHELRDLDAPPDDDGPSPEFIRHRAIVERLDRLAEPRQVIITKVRLSIGNMMELIVIFWVASFLLGVIAFVLLTLFGSFLGPLTP